MRKSWSVGMIGVLLVFVVGTSSSFVAPAFAATENGSYTVVTPDILTKRPTTDILPADFPIPDDAVIDTSQQTYIDGQQNMVLVFHTKSSMETLAKTYNEYFRIINMDQAIQTLNEQQLSVKGTDPATTQQWSLKGAPTASKDTVEVTVQVVKTQ
ncbi:hypothetical protein QE450_003502 [Paenibacillus sp. SORGH_AS306]|uniref:hypothetical protein n=1 Tax=unclassified Paenibacillus TaxID=185978 RepID=UPI00278AA22A|nr:MULTISPECIES: hypothetical protein [unclassified Paenibacillus]MDQ1236004.1 hypothetical protein [Paenibacillus sp. SORGH_AS_0306]MDR6108361.1 hypothetical protein [Paenibacillus sp. SORGH_AS_0338]